MRRATLLALCTAFLAAAALAAGPALARPHAAAWNLTGT